MNRNTPAAVAFTLTVILCIAFAIWSVTHKSLLGVVISACATLFAVQLYKLLRLP